jgi:adenylate cyclase class 2
MEILEFEVKFYLAGIRPMRQAIIDLGARSQGRYFETNLRFEDAPKTLIGKKSLLRLRQGKKTTLTFKSKPLVESSEVKVLNELEVEVSDFATMNHILKALGFHCEQVYEKWRETLILENTQFCLDVMPYGKFLEIEGTEKDIKEFARRLGLQWDTRILANYLQIFDIIRKKQKLLFTDVTFDNFKEIDVQLQDYLHLIEGYKL